MMFFKKKAKKLNYCTLSPDTIFGVYIGYSCKEHDSYYREDPKTIDRKTADNKLRNGIKLDFAFAKKPKLGRLVATIYYYAVRMFCKPSWERYKYKWVFFGFIPIRRKNA